MPQKGFDSGAILLGWRTTRGDGVSETELTVVERMWRALPATTRRVMDQRSWKHGCAAGIIAMELAKEASEE